MKVTLTIKKGVAYQILTVDGRYVASIWGKAKVTGQQVNNHKQVTVNDTDNFLWVDEVVFKG